MDNLNVTQVENKALTKRMWVKRRPTEQQEQVALAKWLDMKKILFYHIPNGGGRKLCEAMKLKKMGVKPGVPDICIPIPMHNYHGLYIELKRTGPSVAKRTEQKYWIKHLSDYGYKAIFCYGAEDAIKAVEKYFSKAE